MRLTRYPLRAIARANGTHRTRECATTPRTSCRLYTSPRGNASSSHRAPPPPPNTARENRARNIAYGRHIDQNHPGSAHPSPNQRTYRRPEQHANTSRRTTKPSSGKPIIRQRTQRVSTHQRLHTPAIEHRTRPGGRRCRLGSTSIDKDSVNPTSITL